MLSATTSTSSIPNRNVRRVRFDKVSLFVFEQSVLDVTIRKWNIQNGHREIFFVYKSNSFENLVKSRFFSYTQSVRGGEALIDKSLIAKSKKRTKKFKVCQIDNDPDRNLESSIVLWRNFHYSFSTRKCTTELKFTLRYNNTVLSATLYLTPKKIFAFHSLYGK